MAVINLDLAEIFEEAYERAGRELRSGYDLKTIRRSFNLLTAEWANRGLNLWTVEQNTQLLTAGTATYTLTETDIIDLIEHVLRRNDGAENVDYHLERFSVSQYARQNNKDRRARPTRIYIDRAATNTKVTLWPTPDQADTLVYWRLAGIEGLTSGIGDGVSADMPRRFVPALTAGLAFHAAMKAPNPDPNRVLFLKGEYESQFKMAADEDRDKSSVWLTPKRGHI